MAWKCLNYLKLPEITSNRLRRAQANFLKLPEVTWKRPHLLHKKGWLLAHLTYISVAMPADFQRRKNTLHLKVVVANVERVQVKLRKKKTMTMSKIPSRKACGTNGHGPLKICPGKEKDDDHDQDSLKKVFLHIWSWSSDKSFSEIILDSCTRNGRNTVSRVLFRRRELTEPHRVLGQTRWVLQKTRWARFGTQIIGWEELTEFSPQKSVRANKTHWARCLKPYSVKPYSARFRCTRFSIFRGCFGALFVLSFVLEFKNF